MSEEKFTIQDHQTSDISFHVDEGLTEVLKICQDGSFYVRGKKVTEDIDVYNGFVDFLRSAGFYNPP